MSRSQEAYNKAWNIVTSAGVPESALLKDKIVNKVAAELEQQAERVEQLEDAITEAGMILAEDEIHEEIAPGWRSQIIKRAMKRLGSVMNDPAVLKRQGI